MTEVLNYELTELFEDLEKDLICSPMNSDCPNPATWLAIQTCCGWETLCCTDHHNKCIEWEDRMSRLGWMVQCVMCGADPLDIRTSIRWEKLK